MDTTLTITEAHITYYNIALGQLDLLMDSQDLPQWEKNDILCTTLYFGLINTLFIFMDSDRKVIWALIPKNINDSNLELIVKRIRSLRGNITGHVNASICLSADTLRAYLQWDDGYQNIITLKQFIYILAHLTELLFFYTDQDALAIGKKRITLLNGRITKSRETT